MNFSARTAIRTRNGKGTEGTHGGSAASAGGRI